MSTMLELDRLVADARDAVAPPTPQRKIWEIRTEELQAPDRMSVEP